MTVVDGITQTPHQAQRSENWGWLLAFPLAGMPAGAAMYLYLSLTSGDRFFLMGAVAWAAAVVLGVLGTGCTAATTSCSA